MISKDPRGQTDRGSPPRQRPQQLAPDGPTQLSPFLYSSHPAAEKSPAPGALEVGPAVGSGGRSPRGSLQPIAPRWPWAPAPSWAWSPLSDEGSGSKGLWPAQNCGECQRQTNSLFNNNERTFESFLKIHYAQGRKNEPLDFLAEQCQGQRPHGLAVCL